MLQQTNGTERQSLPEPPDGVRTADPRDYSEVCRLLLLAHAEAGMFPADNKKVDYHVRRFLMAPWKNPDGSWMLPPVDRFGRVDRQPRGIIGVVGDPGGPPRRVEGLVMLGVGSYWYTETIHLEEYIMFVDPEYRNSTHARNLIHWQKYQAELNSMQLVTGVLSNVDSEAKSALHERMLNKVGEYFTWPGTFSSDDMTGPPISHKSLLRSARIREMKLNKELRRVQEELSKLAFAEAPKTVEKVN